jgi:hypothetical protein
MDKLSNKTHAVINFLTSGGSPNTLVLKLNLPPSPKTEKLSHFFYVDMNTTIPSNAILHPALVLVFIYRRYTTPLR